MLEVRQYEPPKIELAQPYQIVDAMKDRFKKAITSPLKQDVFRFGGIDIRYTYNREHDFFHQGLEIVNLNGQDTHDFEEFVDRVRELPLNQLLQESGLKGWVEFVQWKQERKKRIKSEEGAPIKARGGETMDQFMKRLLDLNTSLYFDWGGSYYHFDHISKSISLSDMMNGGNRVEDLNKALQNVLENYQQQPEKKSASGNVLNKIRTIFTSL